MHVDNSSERIISVNVLNNWLDLISPVTYPSRVQALSGPRLKCSGVMFKFNLGEQNCHVSLMPARELSRAATGLDISAMLHPMEITAYKEIGTQKRMLEWLDGRLSIKLAVSQWLAANHREVKFKDLQVSTDELGCPRLLVPKHIGSPPCSISLSHSGGYVLVGVSDSEGVGHIGVDIQKFAERILDGRHLFMSSNDKEPSSAVEANWIWAAKEAAYKAICGREKRRMAFSDITIHMKLVQDHTQFILKEIASSRADAYGWVGWLNGFSIAMACYPSDKFRISPPSFARSPRGSWTPAFENQGTRPPMAQLE